MHTFPLHECLRDISMNAPMSAAAPANNNGDRSLRCPPSLHFDGNNPTHTPIDPQEWDNFYNKFLQFVNSFNNETSQKHDDKKAPLAATSAGINSDNRPLADTTPITDLLPKKDTAPNASNSTIPSANGPSMHNSDAPTDYNDCHQISANKTINRCAHFAILSPVPPCNDNAIFDYKSKLNEIDDTIMMMTYWLTANSVNDDDHHNNDTDDHNNDDSSNKDHDNDNQKMMTETTRTTTTMTNSSKRSPPTR